jgi:outer membrane immunogenic protein
LVVKSEVAAVKKLLLTSTAALVLIAAPAGAADLSVAPLYKAAPAVPYFTWSGFYVGANGGGQWGRSRWDSADRFDLSGGLAGGTAGYNWQTGNVVFGFEGDVDWSRLTGSTTTLCSAGCTTGNSWLGTVRGRVGYTFDRLMPYVTGGLAFGDIKASTPGLPGAAQTQTGFAVGGGLEYALTNNWSVKAEYLRVDLGKFNCGAGCGAGPTDNVSLKTNVLRAGVNYRFGWGN